MSWRRAMPREPGGDGATPKVAQPSTPATSPSAARSASVSASGSICQLSASTSTNRGRNPHHSIAQALAVNVNDGTITSASRGGPNAARIARSSPDVPLATGTQAAPPPRYRSSRSTSRR